MLNKSKEQLTKINGKWQISWIEGERIIHRDLNWYEEIFVLPAKIYFKIFGLKFPKWF